MIIPFAPSVRKIVVQNLRIMSRKKPSKKLLSAAAPVVKLEPPEISAPPPTCPPTVRAPPSRALSPMSEAMAMALAPLDPMAVESVPPTAVALPWPKHELQQQFSPTPPGQHIAQINVRELEDFRLFQEYRRQHTPIVAGPAHSGDPSSSASPSSSSSWASPASMRSARDPPTAGKSSKHRDRSKKKKKKRRRREELREVPRRKKSKKKKIKGKKKRRKSTKRSLKLDLGEDSPKRMCKAEVELRQQRMTPPQRRVWNSKQSKSARDKV
jgi:hypothetical protein